MKNSITKQLLGILLNAFLVLLFLFFLPVKQVSAAPPTGFAETKVVPDDSLNLPTDFALASDGRIFISEKGTPQSTGPDIAAVKIIQNGQVLPTPFLNLPVSSASDRGLIGLTLDPNFASNHYMYLMYVSPDPNAQLRVSRFTANGNQVVAGSEKILIHSTQPQNLVHYGGTMRFGPDGDLWISVGNNDTPSNPQDLTNIHGKLLRIKPDGSIPSDNPFVNQPGAEKSIWAYGFRNPFRFNFIPGSSTPIIGDVGDSTWEEVNIGVKGGDYGYPNTEGACTNCSFINPIYQYNHNGGSAAIVGGFFYQGKQFPSSYANNYFYADYAKLFIHRITLDSQNNFISDQSFDDNAGSAVELLPDSDGNGFYYLTIFPGQLYHVTYTPGNVPPAAHASATTATSGNLPLSVTFSSNGSSDPEGKTLTYSWDFGDGTNSTAANPTHIYTTKGVYQAKLTVSDGSLTNTTDPIQIAAGLSYPTATITSPNSSLTYNAGDTINYSGNATDAQDGTLPASAYNWKVIFHHQTHIHPFIDSVPGVTSGRFVIPNTGEASAETWYEIQLTVTDSNKLATTVTTSIHPNTVNLTLNSQPQGLTVNVNGIPVTTPNTTKYVSGFKRTLAVSSPQVGTDNNNYQFTGWSDGGGQTHDITIPSQSASISALFVPVGSGTGSISLRTTLFNADNSWSGNYVNGVTVKLTDMQGNTTVAATTSATRSDGQDGWATFSNIPAGNYGVMAYKGGYVGVWKKLDCTHADGTFTGATLANNTSENLTAAWNSNVSITPNATTYCTDLGLESHQNGNLHFRIFQIAVNPSGYTVSGFINDATVKLTDPTGASVSAVTKSVHEGNGQDGWVYFDNVPQGKYGIMAYKKGFIGYLRKTGCNEEDITNATIKNNNTEGLTAAWNNDVTITGGVTTFCYELGLTANATGNISVRTTTFDSNNQWSGNYVNGTTVKLTTQDGTSVVATGTTATRSDGQDGWTTFSNIPVGAYGLLAYKSGYSGVWKKLDCDHPDGTFTNATINNTNTAGLTAAWNNSVPITTNQTTYCTDLGLTSATATTGSIRLRTTEFAANQSWTGNYLNGVTVKLTDPTGTSVTATQTSATRSDGQTGWANFDTIPTGTYGVMAYRTGYMGVWKKLNCTDAAGTFANATIKNANTAGLTAAWNNTVTVGTGQTVYCTDLGLQTGSTVTPNPTTTPNLLPSPRPSPSGTPTPSATPNPLPSVTPAPTATPEATISPLPVRTGLSYFGYYFADNLVGYGANASPTDYYDDILRSHNTNVNMIAADYSTPVMKSILDKARSNHQKIILEVNTLFEQAPCDGCFDKSNILYSNWLERWHMLRDSVKDYNDVIYGFYFDEPRWQGLTEHDFTTITGAIKSDFPKTRIMVIEGAPAFDPAYFAPQFGYNPNTPAVTGSYYANVDDLGFDYYFDDTYLLHPNNSRSPQEEYSLIYAKLEEVAPNKQLWLSAESYTPEYMNKSGDTSRLKNDLTFYYNFAKNHTRVVGLMDFVYSGYQNWQCTIKDFMNPSNSCFDQDLQNLILTTGQTIIGAPISIPNPRLSSQSATQSATLTPTLTPTAGPSASLTPTTSPGASVTPNPLPSQEATGSATTGTPTPLPSPKPMPTSTPSSTPNRDASSSAEENKR